MLSVNGSPLANPLKFGLDLDGWRSKVADTVKTDGEAGFGGVGHVDNATDVHRRGRMGHV